MSKLRLNRDDVFRKICRLLRLPPSAKNTNAFFTREQLTLIANYIEKKEGIANDNSGRPRNRISTVRVSGTK